MGVIGVTKRAKTLEQLTECGIYHVGTLFMLLIRHRRLGIGVIGVTMLAKTGEQLTECGIYHVGTLFMLRIR